MADAKMLTLSEMPAFAPVESCRSDGRRARGVSVGMGASLVVEEWEDAEAEGSAPTDVTPGAGASVGLDVELLFPLLIVPVDVGTPEVALPIRVMLAAVPVELPPPFVELLPPPELVSSALPLPLPTSTPTALHPAFIL